VPCRHGLPLVQQNERQVQCRQEEDRFTSAPPSNWPWYKRFDYLCGDTTKIDGLPPWWYWSLSLQ
jgi:hypothetical protein